VFASQAEKVDNRRRSGTLEAHEDHTVDWLAHVTHRAPALQPDSVYQITQRLFPAYTVEEGRVHLAGCRMDDRLLVRLTFRWGDESGDWYVDAEGHPLPADLVSALGLPDAVRLEVPPPHAVAALYQFLSTSLDQAQQALPLPQGSQLVDMAALWCKYVEGKLRFTIKEDSADLPFGDWTRTLEPPAYRCPRTEALTFHVARSDDGAIVAFDRLSPCDVTGRRTVGDDLVVCAVTGMRVAAELTAVCPVTAARVLRSRMLACDLCGQAVSPAAIRKDRCTACRELRKVTKDDPRMVRILAEHPVLDRWTQWRMAETRTVYIVQAQGWWQQLLLVVDKETLALRRLAASTRLSSRWEVVPPEEYQQILTS